MSNNESIDAKAAQAALNEIESSQKNMQKALRVPLWMSACISISYGFIVFGWGMTEHDNLWALAMWIGGAFFFGFVLLAVYSAKLLGMKINILPKNSSGIMFHLFSGIAFALLLIAGRELRLLGFEFAPFVAAFLCAALMMYFQHWHPAGELQRAGSNDE